MDLSPIPPESLLRLAALLVLWLACVNAATWALAGIDRHRWAFGGPRMSETALLWLAFLGGWPGLTVGLRKSRRVRYDLSFRGWVRIAGAAQVVLLALALAPKGALVSATEAIAGAILPNAVAAESAPKPQRLRLDSERGQTAVTAVTRVVTLSAKP